MSIRRINYPSPELERTRDLQTLVLQQAGLPYARREEYIGYTGKPMVATPGELLFDQNLSDSDRVYWCVLRLICQENGNVNRLPDQSMIADRIGKSRGSIITYNKVLRATRWLTVIDVVRENNLPTRYSYAIHDSPMSIEEVMEIDPEYLNFIVQSLDEKNVPRLSKYCQTLIQQMDGELLKHLNVTDIETLNTLLDTYSPEVVTDEESLTVIQDSDTNNSPRCQDPDSGTERSHVKTDDKTAFAVQDSDIQTADTCQDPDSGSISCQKTDSTANAVVQNPDSEQIPVVQDPDSGENAEVIYNTARVPADAVAIHAHAPTQRRIIPFGNNDNHPSIQDGGCGRKDGAAHFAFFDDAPFRQLLDRLAGLYSKHNAHAILNALKRGSYTFRGETFRHTLSADEAAIILVSLIDRDKASPVLSPLDYSISLIYRASAGELCFVGNQYQRFLELSGQTPPSPETLRHEAAGLYQARLDAIGGLPDGTQLLGKSGTRYRIHRQILLPTDSETHVPNRQDGIGVHIPGIDEIRALIVEGRLQIITGDGK